MRHYLLLTLLLTARTSSAHPSQHADSAPPLRVHVFGFSSLSPTLLELAEAESSRILGRSAPIEWLNCLAVRMGCRQEYRAGDMTVRVLADVQSGLAPDVLGATTLGDPAHLAVIAYDRITALQRHDAPRYSILGKVLAHEITHLLLGPGKHSRSGVMRPLWNQADFRFDQNALWFYTLEQQTAMHKRLSTRHRNSLLGR